ncbi:methylenetetrahydrofolate reductase, partial [Streptomyces corynorhini]
MDDFSTAPSPGSAVALLLEDFSLEMTGKDVTGLEEARDRLPPGTRINVTFLGNENLALRLGAARAAPSR